MFDITDIYLTDYIPTVYSTPCTMIYKQNNRSRKYSMLAERNGVVIIVYNKTRNTLSLVKQFRPSVYLSHIAKTDYFKGPIDIKKYPIELGITLEFCAGLEDKQHSSTEQVAKEEILEECGYDVSVDQLERIGTIKNLTETTGARSTYFYCEVTDEMRVHSGGGVDDECIVVIEMGVEEILEYVQNDYINSPINFMYCFYWFLYNKYKPS